jgi:hypothetical protein
MALKIKGAPVLDAQATLEFFERVEKMAAKERQRSPEELEERKEEARKWREYFEQQRFQQCQYTAPKR